MDSCEAEASTHSERHEDTAPSTSNTSGQGEDGPKPKTSSLKRSSGEPTNAKAKKQKKTRVSRSAQVGYTVHQGEDMLLVISSTTSHYNGSAWTPQRKRNKKKKPTKGKLKANQIKKKKSVHVEPKVKNNPVVKMEEDAAVFVPQKATDNRWGESLPEEVLMNIFQMVVNQDGAVPFLCR